MGKTRRFPWLLSLCLIACSSPDWTEVEPLDREQEDTPLLDEVGRLNDESLWKTDCDIEISPLPPIDACVVAIDSARTAVVLDKGARDAVKPGYLFDVYSGRIYKGQVRVTEVDETTCIAELVLERQPMRPGDDATTLL